MPIIGSSQNKGQLHGSPPSAPRMPCITLARRGLGDRCITQECRHLASLPNAAERWSCSQQPGRATEALLVHAHGFSHQLLTGLVRAALAAAEHEVMKAGGLTIEIVRVRITAAGRRAPIDSAAEQLRLPPREADRDKATVRASSARRQQLDR